MGGERTLLPNFVRSREELVSVCSSCHRQFFTIDDVPIYITAKDGAQFFSIHTNNNACSERVVAIDGCLHMHAYVNALTFVFGGFVRKFVKAAPCICAYVSEVRCVRLSMHSSWYL